MLLPTWLGDGPADATVAAGDQDDPTTEFFAGAGTGRLGAGMHFRFEPWLPGLMLLRSHGSFGSLFRGHGVPRWAWMISKDPFAAKRVLEAIEMPSRPNCSCSQRFAWHFGTSFAFDERQRAAGRGS